MSSQKNPDIRTRLRTHPEIMMRRSPGMLWAGVGVTLVVLTCWVVLLVNAGETSAQFAEHQDTAVTLNQRLGSRFGVLIGVIALPLLALLPLLLGWFLSPRYHLRATGARLMRSYHGVFPGTSQQGDDFQNLVRTRDPHTIGPMNPSTDRGNLIIEGWVAASDRIAYVGVYASDLREDPHWELVKFAGPEFAAYEAIFGKPRA